MSELNIRELTKELENLQKAQDLAKEEKIKLDENIKNKRLEIEKGLKRLSEDYGITVSKPSEVISLRDKYAESIKETLEKGKELQREATDIS